MRKMIFFGLLLSFLLLIGTGIGLSAALGDVTVKLTYNVDNVNEEQENLSQAHGTALTHEAPLKVGGSGEFNYWLVNGILRTDLARNLSIVTRSTTELVAVYGHPTNPTVTFIDSNGKYIKHLFVESGSVVAEGLDPDAPGKPQSTFAGWKGLGSSVVITDEITSNTVFIATYTENAVTAELVVDGGTTPTTYPINSVVSLTLGEGFTHWEDGDGNVLSYAETFKFSMLVANRKVVRATGGVKAPVVNMIAETGLREGYTSYVGQFDSNGLDVIEYGFIISRSKDILTIDSLGATIIPSNVYNEQTNEFLRSFELDTYNSIRAYAVFNDGTKQVYEYSDKMIGATTEEQIIYETGFEAPDFAANTVYNNTTVEFSGPADKQWGTYYGTPSTTGPLSGSQSMQMRWYTSAVANLGYTYTNFDLVSVSKVEFSAANTLGLNVKVEISADGGLTWIAGETFTLSTSSAAFTYNVPAANQSGNLRVKFSVVLPDPIPTGTSRLYIDDVKIYGVRQSTAKHEIVSIVDGLSTVSFVNEGSSIPNPTKEGHIFNGWFTDVDLSIPFIGPVNQSLTLYAGWVDASSTSLVSFMDGESTLFTEVVIIGTPVTRPTTDPTKDGYTFNNWYSDSSLTTLYNFDSNVETNISIYAGWEGIPELEPITITLTESTIWSSKNNSYADGNFTKDFSGMNIKADDSGFYTGSNYGDNKIQVKKGLGWIYNASIPEGYIIKSVTVNGQTSGKVNIYFSTNTAKPSTNGILGVSTSGDVSGNGYLYFYIKENNTQSGTVTIDSIVIELIPNP